MVFAIIVTTARKLDAAAPITRIAIKHFWIVHAYLGAHPLIFDSSIID